MPLVANMTEFGKSPLLGFRRAGRLGLPRRALPGYAVAGGDESRRDGAGDSGRGRLATRAVGPDADAAGTVRSAGLRHLRKPRPRVFCVIGRAMIASQATPLNNPEPPNPFNMTEPIYSPGLEGVIAGETAISTVTGGLQYRGYSIEDLARHAHVRGGRVPAACTANCRRPSSWTNSSSGSSAAAQVPPAIIETLRKIPLDDQRHGRAPLGLQLARPLGPRSRRQQPRRQPSQSGAAAWRSCRS